MEHLAKTKTSLPVAGRNILKPMRKTNILISQLIPLFVLMGLNQNLTSATSFSFFVGCCDRIELTSKNYGNDTIQALGQYSRNKSTPYQDHALYKQDYGDVYIFFSQSAGWMAYPGNPREGVRTILEFVNCTLDTKCPVSGTNAFQNTNECVENGKWKYFDEQEVKSVVDETLKLNCIPDNGASVVVWRPLLIATLTLTLMIAKQTS